jgi:hypothetical protein
VTNPYPAPEDGPRSPFPQVRWRFERTETGGQLLLWMSVPCDLTCHLDPIRIPMGEREAWEVVRQWDRVMSYAAQSAEGIFSSGPDSAQAASQLAIMRYVVISPDLETHTKLAQATPWANWAMEVPGTGEMPGVSWLVDVFGVDDHSFLGLAIGFGVTVSPAPAPEAAGG